MTSIERLYRILGLAATGAALTFMAACSGSSDDGAYVTYGTPYYYTSDVYDMGTIYDPYPYYFKRAAIIDTPATDTGTGVQVLEPLTFHTECQCFTYHAVFRKDSTFQRDRLDTVIFIDTSGTVITSATPHTAKIGKIKHKRHVSSIGSGRSSNLLYDLTIDVKRDSGQTRGIWNGSISGEFNNVTITDGSVNNVVRPFNDSIFGFPTSGNISVATKPVDVLIEFKPDSTADVTVTDHDNGKTYVETLDRNFKESTPTLKP
jgi:hypothetical protein